MTAEDTPEEKAVRRKRRGKARRNLVLTAVFLLGLGTANLVQGEQNYQRRHQEAIQYRQDCTNTAIVSPSCQALPMTIYEHGSKVAVDSDNLESDMWISLRDKSGQVYEANVTNPQWDNLEIGDTVITTVWMGEVETISGGGETKETLTNPVMSAESAQRSVAVSWGALGAGVVLIALLFWAETRVDKAMRAAQFKRQAAEQGNETSL